MATGYTEAGGGSCLGKQIAVLKGKKGSSMELYDGGIKIVNHKNKCGCQCLGWTIGYEVIPKQTIVGVSVEARAKCCCVPFCCICQIKTSVVCLELINQCESKKNHKVVTFSWSKDELQDKADILHNYVYGSVAGQGIVNDAHNLAHFVNQGLVRPSIAKIELSKN